MNFDTLFVYPSGRTARNQYIGALITLLVAFGFYYFLVPGRNSQWVQLVFLYPAVVLLARRLHDMGRAAWPLIVPAALVVAMAWLYLYVPASGAKGSVRLGRDRRVGRLHGLGPRRQESARAESIRKSRDLDEKRSPVVRARGVKRQSTAYRQQFALTLRKARGVKLASP